MKRATRLCALQAACLPPAIVHGSWVRGTRMTHEIYDTGSGMTLTLTSIFLLLQHWQ